jgi:hypothetical protein
MRRRRAPLLLLLAQCAAMAVHTMAERLHGIADSVAVDWFDGSGRAMMTVVHSFDRNAAGAREHVYVAGEVETYVGEEVCWEVQRLVIRPRAARQEVAPRR